ncbi:hypothetical protein [Sporosarcina sp. P1]|uniref:hypothetical protein n=1 Tax=Sporosarcina sp. P1 TaxID=2048257 RepID=UPI000C164D10|nr:hypothetical protein [Sporosarcina sp. P1]PIC82858.1 hypothetical protein CSV73_10415 [Sporosarcina sp. P1]
MDIFTLISIGFFANLLVFIISKVFKQTNKISLQISFYTFVAIFIASFVIGAWVGLSMVVISSGLFIFVVFASIITTRLYLKNDEE